MTEEVAAELGVRPRSEFRPALDPQAINIGIGAVALHDGDIPARLIGLGSRRLIAMALQMRCVQDGAILLVDEIEHGLEPHRIRHLLYQLSQRADAPEGLQGQVLMTSHNHTAVVELSSDSLYVVRSDGGETTVTQVGSNLQPVARAIPEALLGRKVIVFEGKTEYGICRSLERELWTTKHGRPPLAYSGIVLIEGGGSDAPKRAEALQDLGYQTCLFIDSDRLADCRPSIDELECKGVRCIYWAGETATEDRLALDISWEGLKKLLDVAVSQRKEKHVKAKLCERLGLDPATNGRDIDMWIGQGISECSVRKAIGECAREEAWFKRIDYGESLGTIIVEDFETLEDSDLAQKIRDLEKWAYE